MGLFGMDEKQLKEFASKLDQRELSLKNKEADIKRDEENLRYATNKLESDRMSFYRDRTESISALAKQREDAQKENEDNLRQAAEQIKVERDALVQERADFIKEMEAAREADRQQRERSVSEINKQIGAECEALLKERADFVSQMERLRSELAQDRIDIEKRRQEVIRLEAEAKANFAEMQNKAFRDIIEKRENELNEREQLLNQKIGELGKRVEEAIAKEGELAKRELDVTEREQKADAGFADKASALAEEARRQAEANQAEAERLKAREEKLLEDRLNYDKDKETLRLREQQIAEAERLRDAGFIDERTVVDREIDEKRSAWLKEEAEARKKLQDEIAQQKTIALSNMSQEISSLREKHLAEITSNANTERDSICKNANEEVARLRGIVKEERDAWDAEKSEAQKEIRQQREANEKKTGELSAKEDSLTGKENELEMRERFLDKQKEDFEQLLEERLEERKTSFDNETAELKEEISRLRNLLQEQTRLVGAFEALKRQLGDKDPAEVLNELSANVTVIRQLREDLANRPAESLQDSFRILENENEQLKAKTSELEKTIAKNEADVQEVADLRRKNGELESDNKCLSQKAERFEASANEANAELQRLRSAYERPAEVAARYKEIEMPYIAADKVQEPEKIKGLDEIKWLDGIGTACDSYGLHFPKRILYAFHTAIKTAEWSPVTILAGVSGTGKSELPKLYSHFGGFLFEPLSVQPNWDSQESMLGFFNSIDNKFDAQPVLRLLAQSQLPANESYEFRLNRWQEMANTALNIDPEKQKELLQALKESAYPGLRDGVCMILLDEMNLAHPELYFAEFLSKLELRRSSGPKNVPRLPVKIGAGLPPYQLQLGRNVFWVGTMNQDETTKSLSDKVLDRSIVIYFPRPLELKSRKILKRLDESNRGIPLHKETFFSWFAKESQFTEEQITPYKKFIEGMNRALGVAGRAIGHRVWQSIEYYMANYPDVRAALCDGGDNASLSKAMHMAFEDQLVQKVMPKLRGIDTRGKFRTECLEVIQGQLRNGINNMPFNLDEDFNLACELGYGQFIWQSANYLNDDQEKISQIDDTQKEDPILGEKEEPPAGWRKDEDEDKRHKRWEKMTQKQREEARAKFPKA